MPELNEFDKLPEPLDNEPREIISLPAEIIIPPAKQVGPQNTWKSVIDQITNMTAEEASKYFGELAGIDQFQGRTLKEIMVIRAIQNFIIEPNSQMMNTLIDRVEGKVADRVDLNQVTEITVNIRTVK